VRTHDVLSIMLPPIGTATLVACCVVDWLVKGLDVLVVAMIDGVTTGAVPKTVAWAPGIGCAVGGVLVAGVGVVGKGCGEAVEPIESDAKGETLVCEP
jgi:hypothetical protein